MHRFQRRVPFLVLCLLPLFWSCGVSELGDRSDVPPQDPLWSSVLSRHTQGVISRRDKIRLVFAEDVVGQERVGQDAGSVVTVEPEIDGSITFAGTREIVIVPSQDLPSGRAFTVTLLRGDLGGIPEGLDRYQFGVQVMSQEFEVAITGVSPSTANDTSLVLYGTLITADFDDPDRVERVLTATFLGESLDLAWQHEDDGRRHGFTVTGITRQGEDQELQLSWEGDPIEVESVGERRVTIPAVHVFTVTSVEPVQGDRDYIVVHFSDQLDQRQNLSGLVSLTAPGFTTDVERNRIRIYTPDQLTGRATVTVEPGIRSADGRRLENRVEEVVTFAGANPGVRFAGAGNILPDNDRLTIPIEAVNVRSVQVTAMRVFETNIGQFLQTNTLAGSAQVDRVGRYLWRRTIPLTPLGVDQWNRYSLDLSDLLRSHPGELVRITLSINRGNIAYACTEEENSVPVMEESPLVSLDDFDFSERSNWDGFSPQIRWVDRDNPCKDAYYRYSSQTRAARNFLASNIGIVAKKGVRNEVLVTTTDLRDAEPMSGVSVTFMNFQNQPIGSVTTDAAGMAEANLDGTPFYALAERGADRGYLKMSPGTALQTTHFDVGGAVVAGGLKGFLYGERGVWRPGDDIHLTFVLEDAASPVPDDHPATVRLFNPQGQPTRTLTNSSPSNGFYTFALGTEEDAPTGNWSAMVDVGGSRFSKRLKVETVIPNRLSVELDLGDDLPLTRDAPVRAQVSGQWLSGAIARNLDTDVEVRLTPTQSRFDRFSDYTFDDPARDFRSEPQQLFDGTLDAEGNARFVQRLAPAGDPPGFLTAHFTTRIFERGGAFSTGRTSAPFSPYSRYVGVRLPPGDARRGMLLTDTTHTVEIASLSQDGDPVDIEGLQVALYKIEWKWWWDRSGESLAQYASSRHRAIVAQGEVNTVGGRGTWPLRVQYPAWGRYLLRVCDPQGGHCTGRVLYIDWPGWAGRPQETGMDAAVLSFSSDKDSYSVGEVAQIQLPAATEGRALVTLETGTGILEQHWMEFSDERNRFDVPITPEMSPNAYVSVTLIQPHQTRDNDRPIRLFGVIPLAVTDPETRLTPVIHADDEWRPETEVTVVVSEASGRGMTYTLAVVDEGLLGLTGYQTPDPHGTFYQKEALGVRTWDLFDYVVGAYGGELERILALGGGGETEELGETDMSRFPPVVRFLGPFNLDAGGRNSHQVDLPQYIGAVRVMVVAGDRGAYGSASKSVFVREPLSLLATVPRVVGPGEEITVPVSLFAMVDDVEQATVSVETDDHFEVMNGTATVAFEEPGEKMALLRIRAGSDLGQGRLSFSASSGEHTSRADIALEIRSHNPATVRRQVQEIAPGEAWTTRVVPHGLPGTNKVSVEMTALPPLNLERRLRYLVRYPHGCVEQITSAAFAQLHLPSLIRMEQDRIEEVEGNVQAGIDRLRGFQLPVGSFAYWPGGFIAGAGFNARDAWVTNYVGHFLIEADRVGYDVPPEVMSDLLNHQRLMAQSWSKGGESAPMDQAYRLYTLALAGRAEMGAMNRLREGGDLDPMAAWMLAAAYQLAGVPQVARELADNAPQTVRAYQTPGWSFGSGLRDRGIMLNSMVTLGMRSQAEDVTREISRELYSDGWHSTHSVAYALLAVAKLYGVDGSSAGFSFEQAIDGTDSRVVRSEAPIHTAEFEDVPEDGWQMDFVNLSEGTLYGTILAEGVPPAGEETAAASGLEIRVEYTDAQGAPTDVVNLRQGTDFMARVTVTNRTPVALENLALEHRVASGWEIHNPRLDPTQAEARPDFEYQDIRDDRINTYFSLAAGESKTITSLFNGAYLGVYYMPSISVEAMYDATKFARTAGGWVRVTGSAP